MQEPVGGLSAESFLELYIVPLNKGAIEKNRTTDAIDLPTYSFLIASALSSLGISSTAYLKAVRGIVFLFFTT